MFLQSWNTIICLIWDIIEIFNHAVFEKGKQALIRWCLKRGKIYIKTVDIGVEPLCVLENIQRCDAASVMSSHRASNCSTGETVLHWWRSHHNECWSQDEYEVILDSHSEAGLAEQNVGTDELRQLELSLCCGTLYSL